MERCEEQVGGGEEEKEAARRAAQEEQQRIQEQYRRLMQRQRQMESQVTQVLLEILCKWSNIAPKLLYGRKECDLADLLTPLVIHSLLSIHVNVRGPLIKTSKTHQFPHGGVTVLLPLQT